MCLIQHYISKNFDFFDKSAVFLLAQMCCKDVEGMTRGSPLKRARYLPQHGHPQNIKYKYKIQNMKYKIQNSEFWIKYTKYKIQAEPSSSGALYPSQYGYLTKYYVKPEALKDVVEFLKRRKNESLAAFRLFQRPPLSAKSPICHICLSSFIWIHL